MANNSPPRSGHVYMNANASKPASKKRNTCQSRNGFLSSLPTNWSGLVLSIMSMLLHSSKARTPDAGKMRDIKKNLATNTADVISLFEFQSLLYTQVDNEVDKLQKEDAQSNDLGDYIELFNRDRTNPPKGRFSSPDEVTGDTEALWETLIGHGWEMASGEISSLEWEKKRNRSDSDTDANATKVDGDLIGTDAVIGGLEHTSIDKANIFLICSRSESYKSGFERVQALAESLQLSPTNFVLVSNEKDQSCYITTMTESEAFAQSDYAMIPFVDIMKISSFTLDDVMSVDWAISSSLQQPVERRTNRQPQVNGTSRISGPEKSSIINWERTILLDLVPGAHGQSEEQVINTANEIIKDIQMMGEEGNRRRRLRRTRQGEKGNLRASVKKKVMHSSVSDTFSLTSGLNELSKSHETRTLARSRVHFWSRALENGIESEHQ